MRKAFIAFCLLTLASSAFGADRFGRKVISVNDTKKYEFIKTDDVEYPVLSNEKFSVACLVYRGRENYYVEVKIINKTTEPITLPGPQDFISFDKPGYTLERIDTMEAARRASLAGGAHFTPTPPPYVPPTYHTTVNATATTYGNQTNIYATSQTTEDDSGRAGANLGNAIGNAIAAHRFYKMQRIEVAFSHFLATHVQTDSDTALQPSQSRTIVATFEQMKSKKKPFVVTVAVNGEKFSFDYKE